jgi:hypothetical protein
VTEPGAERKSNGMRLFDASLGLDSAEGIELTPVRVVETPAVTHIRRW